MCKINDKNFRCKECAKTLTSSDTLFCNKECAGRHYGKKALLKDYGEGSCAFCNNVFRKIAKNQIYCSKKCSKDKNLKPRIIKKNLCTECGNIVNRKVKYCQECKEKKKNSNTKLFNCVCKCCGNIFSTTSKDKKFCKVECSYYNIECLGCGIIFKSQREDSKFHSIKCYNSSKKKSHEDFVKEITEIHSGQIILLEKYTGSDYILKSKCLKCGLEMNKIARVYVGTHSLGCKNCSMKSKGEAILERILNKRGIVYESQKDFDDLIFINKLHIDFVLHFNKAMIAIEYDGGYHFEEARYKSQDNKKKFEEAVIRDKIKNQYCIDNEIPLIRIPYWEKENIEAILESALIHYNIIPKTDSYDFNLIVEWIVDSNWNHDEYISKCPKNMKNTLKQAT